MIYRILVDLRMIQAILDAKQRVVDWEWIIPEEQEYRELTGAGDCFASVMNAHELNAPLVTNPRARFYFTETGWRKVGRFVIVEAKKRGHVVKVIRRKNPHKSQIVYQDGLQLAILPVRVKKET